MQSKNDVDVIRGDVNRSATFNDMVDVCNLITGLSYIGNGKFYAKGSDNPVGAGITNTGLGFYYLKFFTNRVNVPNKPEPSVWTYFDLLLHFRFKGNFKDLMDFLGYGYSTSATPNQQKRVTATPVVKAIENTPKPTKTALIGLNEPYYKFVEEIYEEISAIYQYECKKSRTEADLRVILENPSAKYERVFRVCTNDFFINKSADNKIFSHSYINKLGKTVNIYKVFSGNFTQFELLNTFWRNEVLTIPELIANIKKGWAWLPSQMKSEEFVYRGETYDFAYRELGNVIGSELFAIDVDGGLTLEQCWELPFTKEKCIFSYTSASHTEENHRYRLVFGLPYFVNDVKLYSNFVKKTIEYYGRYASIEGKGIDEKTVEPNRVWFGSTESKVLFNESFRND